MVEINHDYYPDDVAMAICKLAHEDDVNACEDAIYHIKDIAENPFNAEYFRTFYNMLVKITENHIYD